jgi:transposase
MPGCSTISWSHWSALSPSLTRLPVKLIAAARVKTDARDTIKLARLLAANLVPAVWVPPVHVRELRALVSLSLRLVNQRTQVRNRLHAVLHRHNLTLPPGKPFAAHQQEWWLALDLSSSEKLRVQQDLCLLRSLEELVEAVEAELGRLSTGERMSSSRCLFWFSCLVWACFPS